MFSKLNTKTLLILMALLGGVVAYTYWSDSEKGESTFRADFCSIDTNAVTQILIYPKADNYKEVKFTKAGTNWELSNDKIKTVVDSQTVRGLLTGFALLKAQSLAATSSDQWNEYLVGDTSGTRIKFVTPSKTFDIMVGKFGYNNQTRSGTTYVRMYDEKEVYSVDGFLSFMVNQPFNSWRNRIITKGGQESWKQITFTYPADSGFVMTRDSAGWLIDGLRADSAQATSFIQAIAQLNSSEFADDYKPGANAPVYTVTIEGDNFVSISIKAFPADALMRFAVNSSLNPEAYFDDAKSDIISRLFVSKSKFLK